MIVGIATAIGIEPATRHVADLGFVPTVIADACGAGHAVAGDRALETMRFMSEAPFAGADAGGAPDARSKD